MCELEYEGLLRTKYRICIYPCYVAYMNAMHNKSISRHVGYKLKVSDKTKRCPTGTHSGLETWEEGLEDVINNQHLIFVLNL